MSVTLALRGTRLRLAKLVRLQIRAKGGSGYAESAVNTRVGLRGRAAVLRVCLPTRWATPLRVIDITGNGVEQLRCELSQLLATWCDQAGIAWKRHSHWR